MYLVVSVEETSRAFGMFATATILSLYTSLVYVIGTTISKILLVTPSGIWLKEMPDAKYIIQICEAIVIARAEENLEE